jgi:predicted enzyme related to lactoylglutathione lyase
MSRVIHFEIHASDPDKIGQFYSKLFGWELTKWGSPEDYWLIATGPAEQPGINGGLVRRRGPRPAEGQSVNAFICTIDVASVDDILAKLDSAGGVWCFPRWPYQE